MAHELGSLLLLESKLCPDVPFVSMLMIVVVDVLRLSWNECKNAWLHSTPRLACETIGMCTMYKVCTCSIIIEDLIMCSYNTQNISLHLYSHNHKSNHRNKFTLYCTNQ